MPRLLKGTKVYNTAKAKYPTPKSDSFEKAKDSTLSIYLLDDVFCVVEF